MYYQQRQPPHKYRKINSLHKPNRYHLSYQSPYQDTLQQQDYRQPIFYRPLYSRTPNKPKEIQRTRTIPTYNTRAVNMKDEQSIDEQKYPRRKNKFQYFKYQQQELDSSFQTRNANRVGQQPQQQRSNIEIWKNPDTNNTKHKYTKLYRIKPRRQSQKLPQIFLQKADISRLKVGKIYKSKNREHFYEVFDPSATKPHYLKILQVHRRQRLTNSFRKIGHVILFVIFLKGYNRRMRQSRSNRFQSLVKHELGSSLFSLKSYLIDISRPLLQALVDQHQFDYILYEKDDTNLKRQKIKATKHLINIQIQCLQKGIRNMANQGRFTEILYYLCKHGSFASFYELMTSEQLNLSCLSQNYGYLRADKHLQQSGIILLVLIKILLYNMFLQPSKIDVFDSCPNQKFIYRNSILIGNILYELFLSVQDTLLEKAATTYSLANWSQCKSSFPIKTAQSMTVKKGFYQAKDLISGLSDSNFIKKVYKIVQMGDQTKLLLQLSRLLHQNIVQFHKKIRKQHL